MRKFTIILMLVVLILGACSKTTQSGKVKITFWHGLSGPLGDVLTDMIPSIAAKRVEWPTHQQLHGTQPETDGLVQAETAGYRPVFESWTSSTRL